jgi:hypothetical protein
VQPGVAGEFPRNGGLKFVGCALGHLLSQKTFLSVLFFQMGSPFPRYEVGDLMRTVAWPLGQNGQLATVEKVLHSSWSAGDQMSFQQDVYCRFPLTIRKQAGVPQV